MVSLLQTLLLGALLAGSTQAATVVSFNWSDLPVGSYYLDVQMASGDGVFGNNSASVKLLSSQNLSFVSPALLNGWASESNPLEFNILDDDPSLAAIPDILNGILLSFTVGASGPGGFQVELSTSNLFSGSGLQDSLTMAILNESFFSTYEENAVGLPLLTALFDGDGSLEFIVNAANVAPYDSIGAPQVEESTIPEPSTWLGAAFGLAVFALRKKARGTALAACAVVGPACAQQAWMVQDVNVSVNGFASINGPAIVQLGNDIVFAGKSSIASEQLTGLYKYNTISKQGARFATLPVDYGGLASAAKGLVITVEARNGRGSLWLSDGTSAGTKLFASDFTVFNRKFRLPNGILLFGTQSQYGAPFDLWRSDGTAVGTYLLAQGASMSRGVVFNGQSYFLSNGQIWKSDGTIQGTGPALTGVLGLESVGNNLLVERAGLLYFLGCRQGKGCEFWSTNGTVAGTQLAAQVIADPWALGDVPALGVFNDNILFTIQKSSDRFEIWKTNGTTAGTSFVKSMSSYIFEGLALNNALVFQVDGGALWRTDGTEAGTYALGISGSSLTRISADTALFTASYTTAEGSEVWKTNGSLAGTSIVKDLNPGPGSGASAVFGFNGKAYFTGSTGLDGSDFWETDGSAAGTRLAFKFNKTNNGISPKPLISLGGLQFFQASGNKTCDLYRTDGTRAGTVKNVSLPGDCDLAVLTDDLLIFGIRSATAVEVWKTNGTQQGTSKIGDLPPFVFSSAVRSGDRVYFNHNNPGGPTIVQNTLYVTDGQSLTALFTTPGSLNPGLIKLTFAPFGQRSLLFSASSTPGG